MADVGQEQGTNGVCKEKRISCFLHARSVEEAVTPLQSLLPSVNDYCKDAVAFAKQTWKYPKTALSQAEVAAVSEFVSLLFR